MRNTQHQKGFTLVELAIVLVIIGLIVGGVLVGQDLIKAASIRAATSDLEKLNAAANTFTTKYGGLPGDLIATNATQFNLTTRSGAAGHGDGNGLIEGCSAGATVMGCENVLFWRDLAAAQLISSGFSTATDALVDGTAGGFAMTQFVQSTRLRTSSYIQITPRSGRNYFMISNVTAVSNVGVQTVGDAVTPGEGRAIDEKTDDALPLTGVSTTVTAMAGTLEAAAAPATGVCVSSGTTPSSYNVRDPFGSEINCSMQIRTSF